MDRTERRKRVWKRIKTFFGFFSGYIKIEMNPRTEREKQLIRRRIFWIVFLVIVFSLITYGIFMLINGIKNFPESELSYYEKYLTMISFLSVILAAIVTITTTFFIVHQNKRIDYHKERLSVMPFLEISLEISQLGINETNIKPRKRVQLFAANKGNGLAINVLEKDSDFGCSIPKNITVNSCAELEEYDNYFPEEVTLQFKDIFENEYEQTFQVLYLSENSTSNIYSSPPELVKRTSRFRYIQ